VVLGVITGTYEKKPGAGFYPRSFFIYSVVLLLLMETAGFQDPYYGLHLFGSKTSRRK
jgi:hypothetical protein